MEYKYLNKKNFNLHLISIEKFKTIQINIKYKTVLSNENVTYRSLLPYVLKAGTKKYNSKLLISRKLEEMYGASLYAYTSKVGRASIINFSITLVDWKYIDHPSLLNEAIDFLKEIIFNPLLINGTFEENIFNEEKRLLKEEFISNKENKAQFAMRKMIDAMMADEIYKLSSLGIEEELESITAEKLFSYYQEMVSNDEIDIVISGDINKDLFKGLEWEKGNKAYFNIIDEVNKDIKKVNKVIIYEKTNQSYLSMGFRTFNRINQESYFHYYFFNAMLGGFSHSRLFKNVREKESLAYSISSSYDALKGVLFINAGIDALDKDKALKIILKQINDLQEGDFLIEEMVITKKAIINNLKESMDTLTAISRKVYFDRLTGRNFSLDELISKVNNVTKEDIVKAVKTLKLDTVLFLVGDVK